MASQHTLDQADGAMNQWPSIIWKNGLFKNITRRPESKFYSGGV